MPNAKLFENEQRQRNKKGIITSIELQIVIRVHVMLLYFFIRVILPLYLNLESARKPLEM
jgi:hypothetical protein